MNNKKEANKQIKHHTPYCYEYHDYFFKKECEGVLYYDKYSSRGDVKRLNRDVCIEIDLKYQNNKTIDHMLETRIPDIYGLIIKNVQLIRNEKPFDIQMHYFLREVLPHKLNEFSLFADGSFSPRFSNLNIELFCKCLKENVGEVLKLSGFEFTDEQFNEIIESSGHLQTVQIKDNTVTPSQPEESTVKINLKPLIASKTLCNLYLTNNGWGEELSVELHYLIRTSKLYKRLNGFKIAQKIVEE